MNTLENFRYIKSFIFDVDGVLTDSTLLVTEQGELLRTMNVRDGYALKQAKEAGYHIAIITGGKSEGVKKRLEGLGIQDVYLGASPKINVFEEHCEKYGIRAEEILYLGDDIIDIEVMKQVGISACPADAVPEVKNVAHYVCAVNGGQGCAREVIEKVMKLNDVWPGQKFL